MVSNLLLVGMIVGALFGTPPRLQGAQQTPAPENEDLSIYVSPFYGFVVDWDEALWTLEGIDQYEPDDNQVWLEPEHGRGRVTITARERADTDPAACLARFEENLREEEDYSDVFQTTEPAALPAGRDPQGQAALYAYTETFPTGTTERQTRYFECRPLVPGEAVLEVDLRVPAEDYGAMLEVFEVLLVGSGLEAGAGDDLEVPVRDAYVSPDFGFSLAWDPEVWTLLEWDNVLGYSNNQVTLDADTGGVEIAAYNRYDGDPAACLEDDIEFMEEWEDVRELEITRDADQFPDTLGPDAAVALYTVTFEPEEPGAAPEPPMIRYFECRPLAEGESVLWIDLRVWTADDYPRLLPEVERLLATIEAA